MRQLGRARVHAYRLHLRSFSEESEARPPGVELRSVPEAELLPLLSDEELQLPANAARASYMRGEVSAGAFRDGRLVGYCWYAYWRAPHVLGLQVRFPPDAMHAYRAFVRADSRGRGIGTALCAFGDRAFLAQGRHFAIYCIEMHNYSSIAAMRQADAEPLGNFVYMQIGPQIHALYSAPVSDLGFRFERAPA